MIGRPVRPSITLRVRRIGPVITIAEVLLDDVALPVKTATLKFEAGNIGVAILELAPGGFAIEEIGATDTFTHEHYRGTVCIDCGKDASHQPPEVRACLECGGELVARYAARTDT